MGTTFTWNLDAEAGVYKNHHISGQLLKVAARDFKFVPFTSKEDSYGKGKGESITLIYYKPLTQPTSAQLEEETRIPIDQLTSGKQNITIKEWGRGVEYTDLAKQLSKFSPGEAAQAALIDQLKEAMDNAAATEFTGTDAKLCYIPTSLTGGTMDTDGTASTAATVNVTKHHISAIRDYMIKDIHCPFFDGEHYMGLMSTKALRGLRDDKVIEAWNLYLRKGDHIYKGEIGQIENVRFIEVTNDTALSNSAGTGSVLGEGVIFGKDAVARIEIEFPHLRAQPNYTADFGRRHAVAWYGTVAFGVKFPTATDREARIIRITSS
ncbi:MAG: N4-gp56 family major capsid protein [Pseudomonadota bacterium]|uniref:Putative capsid protein n=1 Tax=viral metagenome TaxID=1070528 RepID=A0A6H1ZI05_9ZZZZ